MNSAHTSMKLFSRRDALKRTTAGIAAFASPQLVIASRAQCIPGPRTEVRPYRGKPSFFIDGAPYQKPIFESYVPELKYFKQFAEAGTDVFSFSTNLGNGFGAPVWVGPDAWDFDPLDRVAHRVLEANPKGLILPRIFLSPPSWWVRSHPDECQVLSNGGKVYKQGTGHGRDGQAFPSLASPVWRADTAVALQRVIRHMQASDYGAHLFGYMITGLMSEEWYHWSIHTGELSDYSPHALMAFRQWLQDKYGSVDALKCAWNDSEIEWDSVSIPTQAARESGRMERTFRDPASEMQVIDWYQFYNELVPDTMNVFLHAAKEACGFCKVVGAFYCYMFEFGGDPEFGHNALGHLLRSPHLDFAMVTASYHSRELGRGADYARAPITSVALHNKLWYHDNDTVSFRYDAMNRDNPDRATVERYRRELGVTENSQETIWQYRRGAGFVLGNGVYQSFFDLHGGYFDDPRLMSEVRDLNRLFEESQQYDRTSDAQILVVSDEASCSYATFENGFLHQTLQRAQLQFAKIGAPHDSVLLEDLELLDIDRYRLVIFLNTFHLTDFHRELIRRKVLQGQRTVLWCYAAGIMNGAMVSYDAMSELTGFRLIDNSMKDRRRLLMILSDAGRAFLETAQAVGDASDVPSLGYEHIWASPIAIQDPSANTLGYLHGTDSVALVRKKLATWTSMYTLNPVLPSFFLRAIAIHAGVHIYNRNDDSFYACRSFFGLNADGDGERKLHFPLRVDLFDPLTREQLASNVSEWTRYFKDKETLLMRYERSAPTCRP